MVYTSNNFIYSSSLALATPKRFPASTPSGSTAPHNPNLFPSPARFELEEFLLGEALTYVHAEAGSRASSNI